MIGELIPQQGFEAIRDRIGSILLLEITNQKNEFNNSACDGIKIYSERLVPVDKTEADFINVSLYKGDYSNKNSDYVDGVYQFAIDIITNAKTTDENKGDTLSAYQTQKLIGIVRYILEASIYSTLLFDRPFILHTELSKFQIYKPEPGTDAYNSSFAQMIFTVRCGETTKPINGLLITDNGTSVRLGLTDRGYEYQFEVNE